MSDGVLNEVQAICDAEGLTLCFDPSVRPASRGAVLVVRGVGSRPVANLVAARLGSRLVASGKIGNTSVRVEGGE